MLGNEESVNNNFEFDAKHKKVIMTAASLRSCGRATKEQDPQPARLKNKFVRHRYHNIIIALRNSDNKHSENPRVEKVKHQKHSRWWTMLKR
jgi:hypothetical protein